MATADFYTQDGGLDVSSAQQQYIRHELEIRVFKICFTIQMIIKWANFSIYTMKRFFKEAYMKGAQTSTLKRPLKITLNQLYKIN